MISLSDLRQAIKLRFQKKNIGEADLDARLLITYITDLTDIDFAISPDREMPDDEVASIMKLVEKREKRIPMAQIFGDKEFWSLSFKVTGETLTPRPDSETLIEAALKNVSDKSAPLKILDLGTGAGCLLLTLLSELPSATGIGVDISDAALSVAEENAETLNLSKRGSFIKSNWFENINGDKFDIIISNPPYIGLREKPDLAPEVLDHEPHTALFAGVDGLDDYKLIASNVKEYMNENAMLVLEIGHLQAAAVTDIFNQSKFQNVSLYQDLGGRDRCLVIT